MPLTPAKPNTLGFSRNISEMVKAGHPQKQAVAAAYAEAKKTHDAPIRAAAVRVLGEDPADQGLTTIPRQPYLQAAGQPWAQQSTIGEPAPMPIVSKTPHEQMAVAPMPVMPSEPLIRVAGTVNDTAPEGNLEPVTMASTKPSVINPKSPDYLTGDDATNLDPMSSANELGPDDGIAMGETPTVDDGIEGVPEVSENDMDKATFGSTAAHEGFKAVERSVAQDPKVKDPAAVAAAIGMKKDGKEAFERKAHSADEDLPDAVEEAYRVNRSPPTY